MGESANPFKKVGMVLVVIGIIDIGVMIYCITNKISYSSSFNLFAVIAGMLLLKGGVKTARLVRWFSAFFVIGFSAVLLLMPLSVPFELTLIQIKLNTAAYLGSFLFGLVFIGILAWIYVQLSKPECLEVIGKAGYKTTAPKSALYAGIGLVVLGSTLTILFLNSESAEKARALAAEKLGSDYRYHVSSLSTSGNRGSAVVTAYNQDEIKSVKVAW